MRVVLVLALLIAALSFSETNFKFRPVLFGQEALTKTILKDMYYNHFTSDRPKSIYRFKVFEKNVRDAIAHNIQKTTWEQGINQYSDMTWLEFKGMYLMAPQNCSATNSFEIEKKQLSYPTSFEWNNFGAVTLVKNQGSCGSCWAFSAVGALESHWRIQGRGTDELFSEQQLVDCAGAFNNHGCNGGLPSQAFEYIKHAGGIQTNQTYGYVHRDGHCTFNESKVIGRVPYGSYNITQGNQDELADRLYNVGPISVAYEVIDGFKSYSGGVYAPEARCGPGPDNVNHAVLATGYGYADGKPFWNIKNSWGSSWGVNGYFKILRGNNTCAISQCNSYPLLSQPAIKA